MTEHSDAGDGVGQALAAARMTLGFTIADVAQQLKFAPRQIEALEQGRYDALPTGTFARGMVRAYARLVRIDPEPLVRRISERVATPDNAAAVASVQRPIPITDNARRTNLIYAFLSVAILAVIGGVIFEWQREGAGDSGMTFVPAAAQAPQPAPAAPVKPEPQQVASSSVSVTTMGVGPGAVAAVEHPPAPVLQSAAMAPAAPAEGMRRLSLKFDKESWVEIRGRGGKLLTSQLNRGGTEQSVEGKPPFTLIIGNAQHVRLSYDDKPVDLAPHVKVEVARFTLD